jgi:hypothetical protein
MRCSKSMITFFINAAIGVKSIFSNTSRTKLVRFALILKFMMVMRSYSVISATFLSTKVATVSRKFLMMPGKSRLIRLDKIEHRVNLTS